LRTVQFDDHLTLSGAALAFVSFDQIDDADAGRSASWLGPGEISCADRLAIGRRRAAWLAGRLAAKTAIVRLLSPPPPLDRIEILSAPGGEPVVTGELRGRGIDVSISHTRSMAAAVAFLRRTTGAMGIDIEICDQQIDPALIGFAFSEDEAGALHDSTDARERHRLTLRFWTAKEAVLKAVWRGLRLPLSAVHVNRRDDSGSLGASVQCTPETRVPFEVLDVGYPGHVVSVAIEVGHAG
jgi:phosphopantetheinyl transferase